MEKKGLCSTCIYDEECTFPRKFPVWQCEEFSDYELKTTETRRIKKIKQKLK